MGLFKALTKIAFAPVRAVAEVVKDVSGDNDEAAQGLSILTLGASSVVKGVAKSVEEAAEEVYDKED